MSIVPQTAYSKDDSRQDDEANSSATFHGHEGKMTSVVAMRVGSTPSLQSTTIKLSHVVPKPSMRELQCSSAMRPDNSSAFSSRTDIGTVSGDSNEASLIGVAPSASHVQRYRAGNQSFQKSLGQTASLRRRKASTNTISGRWTAAEHVSFLKGLKVYGREWKKVATCIPTRTSAQIRSHAQKYFAKVSKEQQQLFERRSILLPDNVPSKLNESALISDQQMSQSLISNMDSIMKNPSTVETRVCKTLASLRERYKHLEDRLNQVQASKNSNAPIQSREPSCGPATAALALEQKTLRRAAEARYEKKKVEAQQHQRSSTNEPSVTPYACVSLASMPSQGGFDSSDVIALSMLGGNLGRERIENKTISTIKDESSLKLAQDRLQLIENEHPRKLRKADEH